MPPKYQDSSRLAHHNEHTLYLAALDIEDYLNVVGVDRGRNSHSAEGEELE